MAVLGTRFEKNRLEQKPILSATHGVACPGVTEIAHSFDLTIGAAASMKRFATEGLPADGGAAREAAAPATAPATPSQGLTLGTAASVKRLATEGLPAAGGAAGEAEASSFSPGAPTRGRRALSPRSESNRDAARAIAFSDFLATKCKESLSAVQGMHN